MNYTENYQLPQWEKTDRILMEDFNEAMTKLDETMETLASGKAEIVFGSYTGKGVYGEENPNVLNLGFSPRAVLVMGEGSSNGDSIMMLNPMLVTRLNSTDNYCTVTWMETGVKWHSNHVGFQFNRTGKTYYYLALK